MTRRFSCFPASSTVFLSQFAARLCGMSTTRPRGKWLRRQTEGFYIMLIFQKILSTDFNIAKGQLVKNGTAVLFNVN